MKMDIDIVKIVHLLTIGLHTINIGVGATDLSTQCQPFSPLFLWQTGTGEVFSYFLHIRFLIVSINKLPEHTDVSIVTFGAENNLSLNFTKHAGHTDWIYNIWNYKPGHALKNEISVKETHKAITNHYKRNDSNKAEIVYVLANNKTEMHGTEKDTAVLRKKKIFIILSGIQSVSEGKPWLKLASNEHHFFELQGNEDIQDTAEAVLKLSCQDSRFVCDTDMYWCYEKGRCNNCTYICSNSCLAQPDFCTQACPYFHTNCIGKVDKKSSSPDNIQCKMCDNSGLIVTIVVQFLVLLFFLFVIALPGIRRKLSRRIFARRHRGHMYNAPERNQLLRGETESVRNNGSDNDQRKFHSI